MLAPKCFSLELFVWRFRSVVAAKISRMKPLLARRITAHLQSQLEIEPMTPQAAQASEINSDVAMASMLFENSGKNGHFWHDLSTGCGFVRRLVEKNARLTTGQYQVLLGALALSSYALRAHPDFRPGAPDIASLAEGYEALAGLVHHLAETDEKRARRHPDVIRDMKDWSRILQNIAHNRSLIDQIAERAHQRHLAVVDNIKHVATGSGYGGGERR